MPYHVIKYKGGYAVANQHTGKVYSKHAMTKEMAEKQMKTLYSHMRPADILGNQYGHISNVRPHDIIAHLNPHLFTPTSHMNDPRNIMSKYKYLD